jgi:hypothetical protein
MKIKIISVLIVFLLSIAITGCSQNGSSTSSNQISNSLPTSSIPIGNVSASSNKASDSGAKKSPSSTSLASSSESIIQMPSNDPEFDTYKEVLQNRIKFYSTDSKKELCLNDFLTNKEIYGTIFKATHFTVLDMDGDKVPEVVLELSVNGYPEFYEVLHYVNGVVYGYLIVYRGLENLKADGTFGFSNGAADNGYGRLRFESNALKTDIFACSQSSYENANLIISYFIDNKTVTKDSFDSLSNKQSGKKNIVWYDFSQKNIQNKLSVSP